ncbi:GLPGLI family protein [Olivibacter sitiensis]|uniref:GLPGLI family protein n=1 Tax=Olivibacter sitiensis TaxID=376470 RepID=UPI00040BFBF4|nr:GLPGLI family protein [Olivibacter sitiensis]
MKSKKNYWILALNAILAFSANAQQANTIIAKATYHFVYIDDTTQRDKPRQEDMVLYLGKEASLYRRVAEEESQFYQHKAAGGSDANFDLNSLLEKTASQISFPKENKSYTVERIIESMFLISDTLPNIPWQIVDENKEIGGYNAQKAIAHFKGRTYTAWFSADVPFPFGPWKLQGLPGLILEAADNKGEVAFQYLGFEQLPQRNTVIAVPKDIKIKKLSQKNFNKIHQAFLADPSSFIKATTGATSVAAGRPAGAGANFKPKQQNNPLELEN